MERQILFCYQCMFDECVVTGWIFWHFLSAQNFEGGAGQRDEQQYESNKFNSKFHS